MTTTTRTPKQTAGNNAFLADVRYWFNDPIFREASAILNADGEAAARTYLLRFVRTLDNLSRRFAD